MEYKYNRIKYKIWSSDVINKHFLSYQEITTNLKKNKTERAFSLNGHEEYDMTYKFFKSDYVF